MRHAMRRDVTFTKTINDTLEKMIVVFPMVDQPIIVIFLWLIQIATEICRIAVMVLQGSNPLPEEVDGHNRL